MTRPNHQSTSTEKFADSFEQIKAEGDVRFRKITQILRASIVESVKELRAGVNSASPATKEFRDSIIQRIKETSRETLEEAQEAWENRAKEESFQDWLRAEVQAAVNAMKATLAKKPEPIKDDNAESNLTRM